MVTRSSLRVERLPVVIAIDVGSTAGRIAVNYISKGNKVKRLYNSEAKGTQDRYEYERGAFNASVNIPECPDSEPAWIRDDVSATSVQFPVKFIVGNFKGIEDSNPLVAEFRWREDDPGFMGRCWEGVDAFMEAMAREIDKLCERKSKPLEIKELCLSIPAHWTFDEDERLRKVVERTFPRVAKATKGVKISFMSEIEYIAHYICQKPAREEDILDDSGDKMVVSSSSGVKNGESAYSSESDNHLVSSPMQCQVPSQYQRLTGDSKGVVGGTAQWEASVSEYCTESTFRGDEDKTVMAEVRNTLMRQFKEQNMVMGSEAFEEMELRARAPKKHSSGEDFYITISASEATRFFQDALRAPLKMAEEKITELAGLSRGRLYPDVQVIVSGGSAKNKKVQDCLKAVCENQRMCPPTFVYENASPSESFKVAGEGAIAAANRKNLRDFIRDGAAFGLQMLQGDEDNSTWDSTAPMLLAGEDNGWWAGWSHTFDASGTDRLGIICNPFWTPKSRAKKLDCTKTYDLIDLLVPEKGRWRYQLCCSESEDEERLWFQRERLHPVTEEIIKSTTVELYLEFDRVANCFLVEPEGVLDSLHCGLGLHESGKFVALTEDVEKTLAELVRARRSLERRDPAPGRAGSFRSPPTSVRRARGANGAFIVLPPLSSKTPASKRKSGRAKPQHKRLPEVSPSLVRARR
ncbi:hypothetical protein CPLU01_14828 [Colletotrichum plurivorum]|uniref:Uncharacterized protein n=1 Tax=Colletotrichum plurivorum TaxID=2175906 RepID=A0A8H6JGI2_9PEZI|nr:hypothetical protein CPLU01_14828 [Colletotrichum plurivorum]